MEPASSPLLVAAVARAAAQSAALHDSLRSIMFTKVFELPRGVRVRGLSVTFRGIAGSFGGLKGFSSNRSAHQ